MTQTLQTKTREVDGRAVPAPGAWQIDPTHTTVDFVVRHLMVNKVRGKFNDYAASIEVGEHPEDSHLHVQLRAASIDTGVADRDAHLRSADFLDVENHPAITFDSTSVTPTGSNSWAVTGDFTVRGVTHPLVLDVEFGGVIDDPWGNEKAFFSATGEIDREDWGLTYNQVLETGGVVVGKKVRIEIEVEAVRVT